jgi:hypothetical protein
MSDAAKMLEPSAPLVRVDKPSVTRLAEHFDAGQQVVGSRLAFQIATPMFLDPQHGDAHATAQVTPVFSAPAFSTPWQPWHRVDGSPLVVQFKPPEAGRFDAQLDFTVHWRSGIEKQTVAITGQGSTLEDAPTTPARFSPSVTEAHRVDEPPALGVDFENAVEVARDTSAGLIDAHQNGLAWAADKLRSYAEPTSSLFEQLAELAVLAAISGVAGVFSAFVAKRLLAVMDVPTTTAAGVDTAAVRGVASVMSDAITGSARAVVTSPSSPQPQDPHANALTDFIARQRRLVSAAAGSYRSSVTRGAAQLRPTARMNPAMASQMMNEITRAMWDAKPTAEILQATCTELQWIDGIARGELGEETVRTPEGPRSVSRVHDTRRDRLQEIKRKGLLDIGVELDGEFGAPVEDREFHVTSASIRGVAQEAAHTLLAIQLANAGIPIRVRVGNVATITRDEIGRLRVFGFLLCRDCGPEYSEALGHASAVSLVDRLLAKSLKEWGLDDVESDDASGYGDPGTR